MASIRCWGIKDREFSGKRGKSKDQRRIKRCRRSERPKTRDRVRAISRDGKINIFSIFRH